MDNYKGDKIRWFFKSDSDKKSHKEPIKLTFQAHFDEKPRGDIADDELKNFGCFSDYSHLGVFVRDSHHCFGYVRGHFYDHDGEKIEIHMPAVVQDQYVQML